MIISRYVIAKVGKSWKTPLIKLEGHGSLDAAERALKIVNEHEERNGRGADYWGIVDWKAEGLSPIYQEADPHFIVPPYRPDTHNCPDCSDGEKRKGLWRTGKCDVCCGTGNTEVGDCYNCEGTGSPVCCRCEGTGKDPETN